MGPKFRFGLYSQGENGDQVMHYEGMKAEKSCNKLQLFDCNYIQKQEIDVVKTNPADPDDGNQIVGQYETNDDQGKRDRIINTLINKITKDISKKSNSNKDEITFNAAIVPSPVLTKSLHIICPEVSPPSIQPLFDNISLTYLSPTSDLTNL